MPKLNCWELKKCGREPEGNKTAELGVCIAALETRANGINSGTNGGRACWAIAGTLCGGKIQGTFALKLQSCLKCDFFKLVIQEEGKDLKKSKYILSKLK